MHIDNSDFYPQLLHCHSVKGLPNLLVPFQQIFLESSYTLTWQVFQLLLYRPLKNITCDICTSLIIYSPVVWFNMVNITGSSRPTLGVCKLGNWPGY